MRFGRLVVQKYSHSENYRAMWLCECDCGNKDVIIKGKYLLNGDTKSCGCSNIERISQMGKDNKKYNDITIKDDIVYVKIADDKYFICDIKDLECCNDAYWYFNNNGYARGIVNGKTILFHNHIIKTDKNEEIDHIDGNRLNNVRSNLRVVTRVNNMKNKGKYINNTSGVTGVSFHTATNKWCAYIHADKIKHHLGEYDNFDDAVNVRKEAEDKYFGEFKRKKAI